MEIPCITGAIPGVFQASEDRAQSEREAPDKRNGGGAEKIISMEETTKFAEHATSNLKTVSFF